MDEVNHPRIGTLPDFGNFRIENNEWYDRYKGVSELMPYAKAVSAKSHEFDENGNETGTDYYKMMKIVLDAGYNGYVGIEYEGTIHSEMEGIRLTLELIKKSKGKNSIDTTNNLFQSIYFSLIYLFSYFFPAFVKAFNINPANPSFPHSSYFSFFVYLFP